MRMPIHIPVPVRCAACALALTLAACAPDGTGPGSATIITFDELAEGDHAGEQYRDRGVEFVPGPLFDGIPKGVLPLVLSSPNKSANRVVFIHSTTPLIENFDPNVLWCRLSVPAQRVQVRVGTITDGAVAVRLVTQDADGTIRTTERTVPAGSGMSTLLSLRVDRPEITSFAVYAPKGLVMVDDVILEH